MDSELRERVEQTVNEKIRPGLQMDGGDIEIVDVQSDGTVRIRLKGYCAHCPFASLTLQDRVERVLRESVTEVLKVESVP